MCEKLNISHYSNCSAANASKDSWFLYYRVKGEAEEECLKKNVNYISILRPGLIMNRDNDDRIAEKVATYIPFLPKITSKNIAMAMLVDDTEKEKIKQILFYKNTNDAFKSIDMADYVDVVKTISSLIKKLKIESIESNSEKNLESLMKNLNLKNEINNMVIEF